MLNYLSRTMLIERLCGVGLYALALMTAYYSVKRARSYRKLRRILNIYLVILTVMGFFYIPSSSADLYRWLNMTRNWHNLPFVDFFEEKMIKSSYPIGLLMIYLCRQLQVDGILPAVCSFLFHWNIFEILKMLYRRNEGSAWNLALSMLLFMSSGLFLEAISGVRCLVALSILARQFCEEFLNQKIRFRNVVWEILAALIHPLALVLWAIRLAFLMIQKVRSIRGKITNTCISVVMLVLGVRYGGTYIESATDKALGFLEGGIYFYLWEYIMGWIFMLVAIYVLYHASQINKTIKSVSQKNLIRFNIILILVELACCFEYTIFHRTVIFSTMMLLPVNLFLLDKAPMKQHRAVIFYTSFVILFLACARGNLCGYKFFLLS